MRTDTSKLKFLSLDPELKVQCYNKYIINKYIFYTEQYDKGKKTYNSRVCVNGSTFNEFKVDYYKLQEIIEL